VVVITHDPMETPSDDESVPEGSSEPWWITVEGLGWRSVRHDVEWTEEMYGAWYPSVLDACMMSLASGQIHPDEPSH